MTTEQDLQYEREWERCAEALENLTGAAIDLHNAKIAYGENENLNTRGDLEKASRRFEDAIFFLKIQDAVK